MRKILLISCEIKNIILNFCDRMSFFIDVANDKRYTITRRE